MVAGSKPAPPPRRHSPLACGAPRADRACALTDHRLGGGIHFHATREPSSSMATPRKRVEGGSPTDAPNRAW